MKDKKTRENKNKGEGGLAMKGYGAQTKPDDNT